MRTPHAEFHHSSVAGSLDGVCGLGDMLGRLSAGALAPVVPGECSGFADARNRRAR